MPDIPFGASSSPGKRRVEGGGQLINCYASQIPGSPPKGRPVLWNAVPGMFPFSVIEDPTHINTRGLTFAGSTIIQVVNEQAYAVNIDTAVTTLLGALSGTGPLQIVQNSVQPVPDIFAVAGTDAFLLFTSASPQSYDGGGALASPITVAMIDNYAIFGTASALMQSTEINSTNIPTNFNLQIPKPNLRRLATYNNELFAFGQQYYRIYTNVAAETFPLGYSGDEFDVGIVSRHAVAGYEDGFSAAMIFAGSDFRVYSINGREPVPISNDDVQRDIGRAADKSLIVAEAYLADGHQFWSLTYPGTSDEDPGWTWEYNIGTRQWHERKSWQQQSWRGRRVLRVEEVDYVGDAFTGDLYRIAPEWPREGTDPLVWVLESASVGKPGFRISANRSFFDFTTGVGIVTGEIPIGTNPMCMIQVSLDGGETYGPKILRPLGQMGDFIRRVQITGTGIANLQGLRYRLEISDAVHRGFTGGFHETVEHAA